MPPPLPFVSVVIPTYNRDRSLARAIQSALDQDGVQVEVWVIDDGSPSPPHQLMARFSDDARVHYLPLPQNQGGGAARNVGIEAARGEWIALLDSDDWWLPGKLRAQLELLGSCPEPTHTVCFTQVRVEAPFGTVISPALTLDPARPISYALFVQMAMFQTSSAVLDARLAKATRFDPGLPRLQDWDFYLRLERHGATFIQLPQPLCVFEASDDPGRISNTHTPSFLRAWIESWRPELSQQAYLGFMANKLAPELLIVGHRARGLGWLARGVFAGVVTPRTLGVELARVLLSPRAFDHLRRTFGTQARATSL